MKRLLFTFVLATVVCGCRVPAGIRRALDVQARYTRAYVTATAPLLRASGLPDRDELEGIGKRLVRNAGALKNWAGAQEEIRGDEK